jgi:hypothetical protein
MKKILVGMFSPIVILIGLIWAETYHIIAFGSF